MLSGNKRLNVYLSTYDFSLSEIKKLRILYVLTKCPSVQANVLVNKQLQINNPKKFQKYIKRICAQQNI